MTTSTISTRWTRPSRKSSGRSAGGAGRFTLAAEGRIDRDGLSEDVFLSRSVTLGATAGIVRIHLANRSSYSPPSLGDQFFQEGAGSELPISLMPPCSITRASRTSSTTVRRAARRIW